MLCAFNELFWESSAVSFEFATGTRVNAFLSSISRKSRKTPENHSKATTHSALKLNYMTESMVKQTRFIPARAVVLEAVIVLLQKLQRV